MVAFSIDFSSQDVLFAGLSHHKYKVRGRREIIVFITFILFLQKCFATFCFNSCFHQNVTGHVTGYHQVSAPGAAAQGAGRGPAVLC